MADGLAFDLATGQKKIIDVQHGRIPFEEDLRDQHAYKVYVDGALKTEHSRNEDAIVTFYGLSQDA